MLMKAAESKKRQALGKSWARKKEEKEETIFDLHGCANISDRHPKNLTRS